MKDVVQQFHLKIAWQGTVFVTLTEVFELLRVRMTQNFSKTNTNLDEGKLFMKLNLKDILAKRFYESVNSLLCLE